MSKSSVATHARKIAPLFAFSVAGVLVSAAFQLIVIRGLGPDGYGLLAAYLALINVAAFGSAAVRSSVAVGVAREDCELGIQRDSTLFESSAYGFLFVVVVVVMLLSGTYDSWFAGLLVGISVIPYFVFARSQGLMQGHGKLVLVVIWTTATQVLQLVLVILFLTWGFGWLGVLLATCLVALFAALGSTMQVRSKALHSYSRPFAAITVKALLIAALFSWLISMDVAWVQKFSDPNQAGAYAAASTLVKLTFLVPATVALYLLPRFARNISNPALQLKGILWSALLALAAGAALVLVIGIWPDSLNTLFGSSYSGLQAIALGLAFALLPWVVSQSVITQLTAQSDFASILFLGVTALAQFALASLVLPNLLAWIVTQGLLGVVVLGGSLSLFMAKRKKSGTNSEG